MTKSDFNTAHSEVLRLVETFEDNHERYLAPEYNESAARKDFIDKLFIALGWDVNHDTQTNPYEQEVKVERNVSVAARVKKADYAFFLKPNFAQERFFVEAKRPSAILDTPDNCFQTIRYAFSSAKAALSILTNFNELYVIDCRFRPDIATATNHIDKKFRFTDFADKDKFGEFYYLFSREAVEDGALERYAETLPKPKGKVVQRRLFGAGYQEIDDAFLVQLEVYREELAKMFKRKNTQLDSESLTEAVQRTIDRLVFLRFLEDKLIEPSTILDKLSDEANPWKKFIAKSREFDKTYNGIIFKQHPVIDRDDFAVDNKVFVSITNSLADKYSPYHFNYIPIHILGSIYERFLGSVIVATAKRATVEQKPEVRKAGGVFYTPQYIVKYIVENTIGALLSSPPYEGGVAAASADGVVLSSSGNQAKNHPTATAAPLLRKEGSKITPAEVAKMRFADIACGSGSFLLGAYEYLLAWHTKYYNEKASKKEAIADGCIKNDDGTFALSFEQKKEILTNNIYGVDIDRQAYEVTQLSLFLKLLEDETQGTKQQFLTGHRETMLPSLAGNIVCGNALVDWDIEDDAPLFRVGSSTAGVSSPHVSKGSSQPTGALTDVRATDTNATDKLIKLNPMSFEQKFPAIMQNGGFDAIIGNPPYVRQEQLGDLKIYLKKKYKVFHGVADLYTYFIERYFNILHPEGNFGIIVSNGWMRAKFGEPLRRFLKDKDILEIIDFDDLPVFKGIAAYPCIMRITNRIADETFEAVNVETLDFGEDGLRAYVAANRFNVNQMMLDDASWTLADERSQQLVSKLRASGMSLGEYVDGRIYRGVLTGLNEAFVIDSETKDRLISEDPKSAELIRPFLTGKDIKRYVSPVPNKYLIFIPKGWTHQNAAGRSASAWFKSSYPSISKYLAPFETKAVARTDKGDFWWELRACAYYDRFEEPKILVPAISGSSGMTLDNGGFYGNDKTNMIATDDKYVLGLINSRCLDFFLQFIAARLQGGFYEYKTMFLEQLPIHKIDATNADEKAMHDLIIRSVEQIMEAKPRLAAAATERERDFWQNKCDALERTIDDAVYKLYNLTPDEVKLVEKG